MERENEIKVWKKTWEDDIYKWEEEMEGWGFDLTIVGLVG